MMDRLRAWAAEPLITPTMVKAGAVTAAAVAVTIPFAIVALPYIDFFNDMAMQHKVKPQMAWTRSAPGGSAVPGDRDSVPGTIPREYLPYPFPDKSTAVAEEAGRELRVDNPRVAREYRPPPPTMEMLRHGKEQFETFCAVCHGTTGVGDGPVPKKGFPTPPSLLGPTARSHPIGRLFHIATMGQNAMPGYARQLTAADRWGVVYYVRALQRAYPAPPEPADAGVVPTDARADPAGAAAGTDAGTKAATGGADIAAPTPAEALTGPADAEARPLDREVMDGAR
jgi:mono/diheme cytochrome c family protein